MKDARGGSVLRVDEKPFTMSFSAPDIKRYILFIGNNRTGDYEIFVKGSTRGNIIKLSLIGIKPVVA